MSSKTGNLYVVSAPSGGGKTTIISRILRIFPDILFSISATTRNPRPAETDGIDYIFLSVDKFKEMINNEEFIEYEEVYGDYYGTPKAPIIEALNAGKSVIFDIDVKGGLNMKKLFPQAALIFIAPPSMDILRQRLIARGAISPEKLEKRMQRASSEMDAADKFDYVVVNDELEEAVEKTRAIIAGADA
jgi:guanylate kinase